MKPYLKLLPDYLTEKARLLSPKSRLLKSQFQHLIVYSEGLQDANHVPSEGFKEGLLFVYKEIIM